MWRLSDTKLRHDFLDFTDPADRVKTFEKLQGLGLMHWSVDDARGDSVYANAVLCVLDGECARHRIQAALNHDLNGRPYTSNGLVNEGGGDIDDAAVFLPQHLLHRELRNVEKARERRGDQSVEFVGRVLSERPRDKNTRVVDQRIDPAEPGYGRLHDLC